MRVTVVTRLTCVPGKAARSAAREHTRTQAQTTRVQSYDRAGAVSALDCAVGAAAAAAAAEEETDAAQQNGEHAPAHAAGALASDLYAVFGTDSDDPSDDSGATAERDMLSLLLGDRAVLARHC